MKLSREQAAALGERIGTSSGTRCGCASGCSGTFALTDSRYQSVPKAEHAIRELWIKLHFMSCAGGVGEPRDERRK